MTHRMTYVIMLTCGLFACSQQPNADMQPTAQEQTDDIPSSKNLLHNLQIPKSWIEITRVNNVWTYAIPCPNDRELQTIDLTDNNGQETVMWSWGTAGQWHALKKITTQGDSLVFETILPYDTTAIVLFTFKYVDKERSIVRWGADDTFCTYIPTQDTGEYAKFQQPCNE